MIYFFEIIFTVYFQEIHLNFFPMLGYWVRVLGKICRIVALPTALTDTLERICSKLFLQCMYSMYVKSFFHRCQKTFQLSLGWRGGQVEGVGQAQKKSFCRQCLHYHPPMDYRPTMTLRIIRDIYPSVGPQRNIEKRTGPTFEL
jgi:hypothetical protein